MKQNLEKKFVFPTDVLFWSRFFIDRLTLSLLLILFILFSGKAIAKSDKNTLILGEVKTEDIVKEIERTLLFSKETRSKIDYYKSGKRNQDNVNSENKITNELFSRFGEIADIENPIEIKIFEPNIRSISNLEKEKLAYNASLIGQYEVSIELFKQLIKQNPQDIYPKLSLAIIYQKNRQNNQAKNLYYHLLKDRSKLTEEQEEQIIANLFMILIEESPLQTSYLLTRLTTQNPTSSYIMAQAAIAYEKIGDYEKAIHYQKRAIEIDPAKIEYIYNLAVFYDKINDYESALKYYIISANSEIQSPLVPYGEISKRVKFLKNEII